MTTAQTRLAETVTKHGLSYSQLARLTGTDRHFIRGLITYEDWPTRLRTTLDHLDACPGANRNNNDVKA